jgi:hypothetical protein
MTKSQSVILNLNKTFGNSQAFDFTQPVAQQLNIGKNAEVALYGATLKRKPIFVASNEDIQADDRIRVSFFPSKEQINDAEAGATIVNTNALCKIDNNADGQTFAEAENIQFFFSNGEYTVDDFSNRMVMEINGTISEFNKNETGQLKRIDGSDFTINSKNVIGQIPYSFIYDKDDYYLGFNGLPVDLTYFDTTSSLTNGRNLGYYTKCQNFPVSNTETKETNGLVTTVGGTTDGELIGATSTVSANTAINTTDYAEFSRLSDSPIFPLFRNNTGENQNTAYQQNQSYFEFDLAYDKTNPTHDLDFCVGFTNTFHQSTWTDTNIPEVSASEPNAINIPDMYLGARFFEDKDTDVIKDSFIELYVPAFFQSNLNILSGEDDISNYYEEGMERICKIQVDNLGANGKYGFRFVAHENQYSGLDYRSRSVVSSSGKIKDKVGFYGRCYSFQFYYKPTGDPEKVVFDSVKHNMYFPRNILEDGFLFDQIKSVRTPDAATKTTLGMQPYLWVNKLPAQFGLSNPRGNFIVYYAKGNDEYYIYRMGMNHYEMDFDNQNLKDVFGLDNFTNKDIKLFGDTSYKQHLITNSVKRLDPNAYPLYKKTAGFTQLYPDFTRYNIELNLPVKVYTTTSNTKLTNSTGSPLYPTPNNIGQKRTILYTTEPVDEDEIQNKEKAFIEKNIVPNNLKFLSLNNPEPININSLRVQVRRAKTNNLALELQDCSLELLIKSE